MEGTGRSWTLSVSARRPSASSNDHPRRLDSSRDDDTASSDGRYLYALDADAQKVFGWSVIAGGKLEPLREADGLPETVAGLAAS